MYVDPVGLVRIEDQLHRNVLFALFLISAADKFFVYPLKKLSFIRWNSV